MKTFLYSRNASLKGAALIIVLALVVLLTGISLAYFSRTTTNRQLAQSSYNDTSADLVARSALDITVGDLKQDIATNQPVNPGNIQPARYPAPIPADNPNLIRYSSRNDPRSRASTIISTEASANGRSISRARWNSHCLIPPASATGTDSTPVDSFTAPDWALVTRNGPVAFSVWQNNLKDPTSTNPNYVVGRYAFAVYDEGGLIDVNVGGFPFYVNLNRPTRPTRRLAPTYPVEESEIMLAAFTPNPPNPCPGGGPNFTPDHINNNIAAGAPFSITPNTNHTNGATFAASFLPHGLSIDPSTGTISGIPTSPGAFTITLTATVPGCPVGTATWQLAVTGFVSPDSTPWPVNLARKGTLAFADLRTLPSTPTAITPTTPVGNMTGFPTIAQINQIMGWRNYATTKQPGAFFPNGNPWFPPAPDNPPDPTKDLYARNFLGAAYPLATSFTTVSTAVQNNRTDQAAMSRQELIKLQRTIGFNQSLLQYLGTFSRELNRPAPDWPKVSGRNLTERFDMTYLQAIIPGFKIHNGNGIGHQYGLQKKLDVARLFGLTWVDGNWGSNGDRFTDRNYYGRWAYNVPGHHINQFPANPDFFQIINYATNDAVNVNDPNRIRNTFQIGAALIDQYDGDDLFDVPPTGPEPTTGNTITIIDYDGDPANYVYGIEGLSYDDSTINLNRPPFAPYPPAALANYVLLNRRFENVGEFGYAYNPASNLTTKILDFTSATSSDRAILDFFTYNEASPRAGIVNLNTRNGVVLASIISGAWLKDQGSENPPPDPTYIVSQTDALRAGQAIVTATSAANGAAVNRADVARLAAAAVAQVPTLAASDEAKETIARALADTGQARTWTLMIDVIAQTGHYGPNAQDLTAFIPEGEKRYWLHIALDRDDGTVLGTQLEEVIE